MVPPMLDAGYERAPLPPVRQDPPPEAPGSAGEPAGTSGRSGTSEKRKRGKRAKKQPAGQRDPFLDNAKYLTIILVALGHAWEPMRDDSRTVTALYFVLYAFHMPAFIIISGYLSRSFEGKPRQIKRLITGVAVPYIVFQTIFTLFMRLVDNPDREFHYQEPGFALWFLIGLFVWRLTTPLWKSMRWPVAVSLGVAVAASVTPTIDNDLDLMRVAQLLPFFVLGLQLRPEHFQMVKRRAVRWAAVPVVLATVVFSYWAVPRMSRQWLLHDKSASEMGVPSWVGGVMLLAVFGCGLVLTACFLAWVPRRNMWFTSLGAGTLYAYLLHVYPVKISHIYGWYDMSWVDHPLSRVAITVFAAAGMTLLCTAPVRKTFRLLMEPKLEWFFRQDAGELARAREKAAPAAPAKSPGPAATSPASPAGASNAARTATTAGAGTSASGR